MENSAVFDFPISILQTHNGDCRLGNAVVYVKMFKELVALIVDGNKAFSSVFQWVFRSQTSNFL